MNSLKFGIIALLILIVSAVTAEAGFRTIYNPFTSKLDYWFNQSNESSVYFEGDLDVDGYVNATGDLVVGGDGYFENDIYLDDKLYSRGDTDTHLDFGSNTFRFYGNSEYLAMFHGNAMPAFSFNADGLDNDFQIKGDNKDNLFYVDASTDMIGIGIDTPSSILDVDGNIEFSGYLTNEDQSITLELEDIVMSALLDENESYPIETADNFVLVQGGQVYTYEKTQILDDDEHIMQKTGTPKRGIGYYDFYTDWNNGDIALISIRSVMKSSTETFNLSIRNFNDETWLYLTETDGGGTHQDSTDALTRGYYNLSNFVNQSNGTVRLKIEDMETKPASGNLLHVDYLSIEKRGNITLNVTYRTKEYIFPDTVCWQFHDAEEFCIGEDTIYGSTINLIGALNVTENVTADYFIGDGSQLTGFNDTHQNFSQEWEGLMNYPSACPSGTAITQLGDSVTCTSFEDSDTSGKTTFRFRNSRLEIKVT